MSQLRKYFVPALLFAAMLFACGILLLRPVKSYQFERLPKNYMGIVGSGLIGPQEVGWPWVFATSTDGTNMQTGKLERVSLSFHTWHLFADIAVLLAALCILILIAVWRFRRHRCWLRISLRELLTVTALVAVVLGWWFKQVRDSEIERNDLGKYEFENSHNASERAYCGPQWLRRLWDVDDWDTFRRQKSFAVDFDYIKLDVSYNTPVQRALHLQTILREMHYVRNLYVNGVPLETLDPRLFSRIELLGFEMRNFNDDMLKELYRWPELRRLLVGGLNTPNKISDRGVRFIGKCRLLERLDIPQARENLSDVGLTPLGNLTNLKVLDLIGSYVTDADVAAFSGLAQLRNLELTATDITDNALETLSKLPSLENLRLAHCEKLTDAGVKKLTKLKRLRFLDLAYTNITDAAVESLADMPALDRVDLSQCPKLTERSVKQLLNMPNLVTVYFLNSPGLSDETKRQLDERLRAGWDFENAELAHFGF